MPLLKNVSTRGRRRSKPPSPPFFGKDSENLPFLEGIVAKLTPTYASIAPYGARRLPDNSLS